MKEIKFFILFLVFASSARAQVASDSLKYLASYKQEIPYFQELITGGQYAEAPKTIEGHPFYFSRQFENGSLQINGITYPQVPLMYDSYRDQVLTFHPIYNQKILINPEKVDQFRLANGDRFQFFEGNQGFLYHLNGLYKVLNEGEVLALVKEYKTTKDKNDISKYTDVFIEKTEYFLWRDGEFFRVNRTRQIPEILKVNKKELKKRMKKQGVRFKSEPEEYLSIAISEAQNLNDN
ncbi:hypothetical protein [Algoriphagus sp. PAP.12]|uniref:hypothetical protein n=1 Tax=Algoriphagus sp. PAP.12 TaxID=2996678 RepID=UPI00227C3B0E|nr:hypothetical protein [Algoriphagus sp. PAP.12]